jgi:hypothetical protein
MTRTRGLSLAAAVLVLVVVAAGLWWWRQGTTVPALTGGGAAPGVVRLAYPDRSLPARPVVVRAGDLEVRLTLDDVDGAGTARVGVTTAAERGTVQLREGQEGRAAGVTVRAVHVRNGLTASGDYVDVAVRAG